MKQAAFICTLPTEALQQCFQYAVHLNHSTYVDNPPPGTEGHILPLHARYKMALALSFVNRVFNQVATPILYEEVDLTARARVEWWYDRAETDRQKRRAVVRAELFCRTVVEAPKLRCMLKSLTVDYTSILHLLRSLSNSPDSFCHLERLDLRGVPSIGDVDQDMPPGWVDIQKGLKRLLKLSHLSLDGYGVRFGALKFLFSLPNLRQLRLSRVGCPLLEDMDDDEDEQAEEDLERLRAASDDAALAPRGYEGKAGFTELQIWLSDQMSPCALQNFLCWPNSLEVVVMGSIGWGGESSLEVMQSGSMEYPWTFQLLHQALQSQRHSLRELRIYQMNVQEGLGTFDLGDFPALELFQVSAGGHGLPSATGVTQFWLTPKLKKLVLRFSCIGERGGDDEWYFEKREFNWVREFAEIAAQRKQTETIGLEEIEVLYEPEEEDDIRHNALWEPNVEFPWDRISNAKKLVEAHGIKFTWTASDDLIPRDLDFF